MMSLSLVLMVTACILALYAACITWADRRRPCPPDCDFCRIVAALESAGYWTQGGHK